MAETNLEAASPEQKKPFFTARRKAKIVDFLMVVPALILLAVFTYYPICKLFQISLTDWNLLNDTWNFVGFKNWNWLFAGSGAKYMWNSIKVTILYTLGELAITMIGGMLFALLFNRMTRMFSAMRAIIFVPKYVAMSSAAMVFLVILNGNYGIFNYLLGLIGIQGVDWLNTKSTALFAVLMCTGWRVVGYGMMIYLSAMMGISKDYYEAASLDGATGRQQFFKITLPMLTPMILLNVVYSVIDIFADYGNAIIQMIYNTAFSSVRFGYASALSILYFLMVAVVLVVLYLVLKRFIVHAEE